MIITLRPISDVAVQLSPGINNYSYVDDITPDNDTTIVYYVRTDTSPEETKSDQYDVENPNIEGKINSITVKAVVGVQSDTKTGNANFYLGLAFSDGVVWGDRHNITPSDGWVEISDTFTHTASGGNITYADVNNCNVLISVYPTGTTGDTGTEPVPPPGGGSSGVPS